MTTADILGLLNKVRKSGDGWTALCPAHEDNKKSLSIGESEDRILIKCHAGCDIEAICGALHIRTADLFFGSNNGNGRTEPRPAPKGEHVKFADTDQDVEKMRVALARSLECQEYIEARGISLKVAADLKWGFVPSWSFEDDDGQRVRKPALAVPHYIDGKLVGVKFRPIDKKLFSQINGSAIDGLYAAAHLDLSANDVSLFEGPEDVALAITYGLNASGINAASAKLSRDDVRTLRRFKRIYLVGDMDPAGQKAMDEIDASLPPEQTIRVRLRGVKDIGELHAKAPADFRRNLKEALRVADIQRTHFTWDDLETESELIAGGTGKLPYLVDDLIPLDDCTMFAGKEGSLKTLLALYIAKCVVNGAPVFGRFPTIQKSVLYLDAENHKGTHEVYLPFFENIGPRQIRFRTLRYGVPAVTDPALVRICEQHRPLLILDSLIRFGGQRDRDSSEMTELMEQIARLVTAGATVILIHHTRRSDEEEYANSYAIGATVAWLYAIVKDDTGLVKHVRMIHKKARGGTEIHRDLIAFPSILDQGTFVLDTADPYQADLDDLVAFVAAQPGGACLKETIKNRPGRSHDKNRKLLDLALGRGLLEFVNKKVTKKSVPDSRDVSIDVSSSPSVGTTQDE